MFLIKESFRWMRRAKLSFLFSLLSTAIGILLIHLSFFSFYLADYYESKVKEQVKINVFLFDSIDSTAADSMKNALLQEPYVRDINYIDKKQAAENFIRETGEDFRDVLDSNPLPASFLISLNKEFLFQSKIDSLRTALEEIPGVEDVVYNAEIFNKIITFLKNSQPYIAAAAALLILLAFYIVYSTLRLIIQNREEEIGTMKLVGASVTTIKLPILFTGLFIGFAATGLTALLLFGLYFLTKNLLDFSFVINYFNGLNFYLSLLTGLMIGFLCSILVTKKITLRIQ